MVYQAVERGKIVKREAENQLILERRTLIKNFQLTLDRKGCIGCGICADMCPKEAVEYFPAEFRGRRAVTRPSIDFKPDKCVLCGECVTACPMEALCMVIEGEEKSPVVEANVFATLIRRE